jgi:hypothetical protein
VPSSLDDVRYLLRLHGWRAQELLLLLLLRMVRLLLLAMSLLVLRSDNSDGWRLRGEASRLTR